MILTVLSTTTAANAEDATTVDPGIDAMALPVAVEDFEGVAGGVYKDGRVFIARQPDQEGLRRFRELGVTVVINLRTPAEMDNRERVPFDEAVFVREQGMEYVHIPLGGDDHPYTPEAVASFASELDKHRGPFLLHCTIAWRASYLWAAYLILYQDFEFAAALDRGEAMAISPPPLQGLLGRPLTLVYDD
jgi:uncharacterized protein (TIGR01244 family)